MSAEVWGGEVVDCSRWLAARRPPPLPLPVLAPPDVTPTPGGRGVGVTVGLLDGQVDPEHPDLRGARVRVRTAGGSGLSLPDPTGHATACASLLVGQGQRQVRGLLPGATLLAAAVLGAHGRCSDEHLVRAVGWVRDEGAEVLVLPFGRTRPGRSVALALRSAAEAGLQIFVAAGNLGPRTLTFPASVSGVVAVTGYDEAGILPQCSVLADLAAPGKDVPAAGWGRLVRLTGSSPAAVLAAGVWAGAGLPGRRDLAAAGTQGSEARERDRMAEV